MWKHTHSPAPGHISWAPWAGLCWPQGQVKWEHWGMQWRRKGSDPLSKFLATRFYGLSTQLWSRALFSTDSMVRFKGSLATVKIDHFPWKAAAGLCLFPSSSTWPVLCLLLLCLVCLTVLYTWLTTWTVSCFWQSLSQLSPQAVKLAAPFPGLHLGNSPSGAANSLQKWPSQVLAAKIIKSKCW